MHAGLVKSSSACNWVLVLAAGRILLGETVVTVILKPANTVISIVALDFDLFLDGEFLETVGRSVVSYHLRRERREALGHTVGPVAATPAGFSETSPDKSPSKWLPESLL